MSFTKQGKLWVPSAPAVIHRGRYLEGEITLPAIKFKGKVVVELIHAATGFVKQRLEFDNLITNAGLDALAVAVGGSTLVANAGCGTGSTAPANTDTALVAEIAPASTNRTSSVGGGADAFTYVVGPPEYTEWSHVREFTTAQANGNLTEIGFFTASSGGTMWMRQLFKDGSGTPITVIKTSSDILRVTYKLRAYPPAADASSTIVISGTTYTWTLRPVGTSTAANWGNGGVLNSLLGYGTASANHGSAYETDVLAARTATTLAGTAAAATSGTWAAYVNGNFFRDLTLVWGTSVGNFATGIGGITLFSANGGAGLTRIFQEVFSPKFAKDSTKQLTLVHRVSCTRH